MIKADNEQIAVGSDLKNYRIEGILGQGGFGVTYRAVDTSDNTQVAIKEYFPRSMAIREADGSVRPKSNSKEDEEMFAWGLERFRKEILTLAKFTHDNIVPILYFFETLGTVYMVMPFVEGDSLKSHVKKQRGMTEKRLLDIVLPLLSGLETMHKVGFLHRDIKPDNIFIQHHNGQPLLLDFGATRQTMGVGNHAMTVVMTPEYAPLEQGNADSSKQGPWTDIFAMGAVMYWAVTEVKPLSANIRATAMLSQEPDPMPPVAQIARGEYSERVMKAIDHAIRISANERPQSIAEWREEMVGSSGVTTPLMRNLSSRIAQSAARRAMPAFDRSALRSTSAPYPPRTGEPAQQHDASASAAGNDSNPGDSAATPSEATLSTAALSEATPSVATPSVATPSVATPSVRLPLRRPPIEPRRASVGSGGHTVAGHTVAGDAPRPSLSERLGALAPKAAPSGATARYIDNENGTITDTKHQLVGLKNVKCFGKKSWIEALSTARNLMNGDCGLADGSRSGEWRLPTKEELPLLIEWNACGAFVGVSPFENFWSKDINTANPANAWFINIDSGRIEQCAKSTEHRVWLVRAEKRW
ncbi:MAG: protein kinase [Magnetococcales bacterium]|nr:protein kinase [Magnetococcales bacterium]